MTEIKIVLLVGFGLALIIAEVLIPSLGVLGILAALCLIGAIVWGFLVDASTGFNVLGAVAILVPGVTMVALKLLPRSPLGKKLVAQGFSFQDGEGTDTRDRGLVGEVGVVEAPLRPIGTARLAGRRVDVTSRGEAIEAGAHVRVLEVQGNRVLVVRETMKEETE